MSKTAFVFPGQGSQAVGMGKDLFESSDLARELYLKADEIMETKLSQFSFEGPADILKLTNVTQPALFVHSYILFKLIGDKIKADFAAGHSLGEYTAYSYADAFTFEEGLKLVKKRGDLMKDAGDRKPGTMAALIELTDSQVNEICKTVMGGDLIDDPVEIVQPANYNCPGQIVISGDVNAVHKAMEIAKSPPYNCRLAKELEVSGAFHSELMVTLANDLRVSIEKAEINDASLPVYSNVEAEPTVDKRIIEQLLYRQLFSPVKWQLLIQNMIRDDVDTFYEIGSGKVLTGLIKKINPDVKIFNVSSLADLEKI
jgi:[acyl-carrier-protein] S-malonyltransferase